MFWACGGSLNLKGGKGAGESVIVETACVDGFAERVRACCWGLCGVQGVGGVGKRCLDVVASTLGAF